MASQLDSLRLNPGVFAKATELQKRIWFTLGAIIIYRLGTHIPLPGINPDALAELFKAHQGGILGLFNMFAGGSVSRMAIFALSIFPYITVSIVFQLLMPVIPTLQALRKEGAAGQRRLTQMQRQWTVVLATLQAWGVAVGLQATVTAVGPVVVNPGAVFLITTVITLVAGTMFLLWLGEQITSRGIGNGISLLIFVGIVAGLPGALAMLFDLGSTGALPVVALLFFVLLAAGLLMFIVFMERSQRRIMVQYPKRQVGVSGQSAKMTGGGVSHLPMKLNAGGVMPPIFASTLLLVPLSVAGFMGQGQGPGWLQFLSTHLAHGQPAFMLLYALLIVYFCFAFRPPSMEPSEIADNLRKQGGFVPGIRPGKNTEEYFDHIMKRIAALGAFYLLLVCLIPEFLMSQYSIPFYIGGTSLLIAVTVLMDTVAQIQSHLLAHQYEGLIRKAKLKGRR